MYFSRKAFPAVLLLSLLLFWGCPSLSQQPASKSRCEKVVSAWQSIQGYEYVWGGESVEEGGFDCSGAIYHVQKRIGEPVPRTTAQKYHILADGPEQHWEKANCGDWIWWQFKPDRPYGHIGMVTEVPTAWQSGSSTGPTNIDLSKNFWENKFKTTKNIKE